MDTTSPPPSNPAREALLETVLATVKDAVYALDCNWTFVLFNRAAEDHFGRPRSEVLGKNIWELFPQGRGTAYEAACRRAMEARETTMFEARSRLRPDRVIALNIVPMEGSGVVVSITDITERRRAEDALRGQRDRTVEILESISDAFYAVDTEWRLTYVNRIAEAWWGRPRDALIGKVYWEEFPQAVGSASYNAHLEAAREHKVVRLEAISPLIGRWVDVSIFPSAAGLSVYFRDITERKQAERRQRLLVNELNHRVKNTLAVVQAIARQTLRDGRDLAEAREAFNARLLALAGAHDVITEERWTGAQLEEVIERAVASQLDRPERLETAGPSLSISPKLALSLSLALHELLTNALKYGSLSEAEGRVALTWRVAEGLDGKRLRLFWREHGGPPVRPPARKGFGSRLIERSLAAEVGGEVRLDYQPGGVVCEIDADLTGAEGPADPL